MTAKLNRRSFLVSAAAVGGAFTLGISTSAQDVNSSTLVSSTFPPIQRAEDFSIWLAILEDDSVIVRVPQGENGQGHMTQAIYTVAEELASDLSTMRPEFASPTLDWQGFNALVEGDVTSVFFAGRSTMTNRRNGFLQAGASARERLKAVAAARWAVAPENITAAKSVLTNTETGETLRYGEVALDAVNVILDEEPEIKDPSEWTLLGHGDFGKLNNDQIATGKLTYGIDVRIDGMKYAAVAQSPVPGGVLKSYDFDAIKDMPGVLKVVEVSATEEVVADPPILAINGGMNSINSAVAVVADHYWQAQKALKSLPVEWDYGDGAKWETVDQVKESAFERLEAGEVEPYMTLGDPDAELTSGDVISRDYWTPYAEHAMMEPLNGTALVKDETLEIWMPTGEALQSYSAVQQETGFEPDNIVFHQTYVGGSFGRRTNGDDARMVAAIAMQLPGIPVQVLWSREQTVIGGRYRAAMATRANAVLNNDGIPTTLTLDSIAGNMSGWFSSPLLQGGTIPNIAVGSAPINTHLIAGPYRGPGYNSASFILDSFIDELSYEAGIDPLEYRLMLYEPYFDPGYVRALNVAAEKIGWGRELPKGEGLGIAVANWSQDLRQDPPFLGATSATAAHVRVDQDGTLHVIRLEVAPEVGSIINYDAVDQQIVGGTIFGFNMAMNEELTLEDGALVETNFDKYPISRMTDVPEINVHFDALTDDGRYAEVGEVPVGPVGPAIANAIFAATGIRVREMPFRKQDLSWS